MALLKKDYIPIHQIDEAWSLGQDALADCAFGLQVLRDAHEAAESLSEVIVTRDLIRAERTARTSGRHEVAQRLHQVFAQAVRAFEVEAWRRTHDVAGQLTDAPSWEVYNRIIVRFLPRGGRSRAAAGGESLVLQCRNFALAVTRALPDGAAIVAPLMVVIAEYETKLSTRRHDGVDRADIGAELERHRATTLRLRRASYHLLKCMEFYQEGFPLDADEIFPALKKESAKLRLNEKPKPRARRKPEPDPEPAPEDPAGLAEEESAGPPAAKKRGGSRSRTRGSSRGRRSSVEGVAGGEGPDNAEAGSTDVADSGREPG